MVKYLLAALFMAVGTMAAQAQSPAAIAGEAFVLGIQTQTNGGNTLGNVTGSFQHSAGGVAFDVSSVMDGAYSTQFGKGNVVHSGMADGASQGVGAAGSSASLQGGMVAFTQFSAFPEAAFTGFAVGVGR
jgi:hypothetical protein